MRKTVASLFLVIILLLPACEQPQPVNDWQQQYDLGIKYLNEGNYKEAIIAFTAAIEIEPKRPEAYIHLAEAYMGLGDTEKAMWVLQQGFEATVDENIKNRITTLQNALASADESTSTETPFESVELENQEPETPAAMESGSEDPSSQSQPTTEESFPPITPAAEPMQQGVGELVIQAGEAYYLRANEKVELQYIGNNATAEMVYYKNSPGTMSDDLTSSIVENDNWNKAPNNTVSMVIGANNWRKIHVTSGQLKVIGVNDNLEVSPCEPVVLTKRSLKQGDTIELLASNPFSDSCSATLHGIGSGYRAQFVVYAKDGRIKNDYEGTQDFWRPMYDNERMEIYVLEGSLLIYGSSDYFTIM